MVFNNKIKHIINEQCSGNKNIFCLKTGIKKITLYKILSGENKNPSIEFVLKIKEAFPDINLNWLSTDEEIKFRSDYEILVTYCKDLEKEIKVKDTLIDFLKNC